MSASGNFLEAETTALLVNDQSLTLGASDRHETVLQFLRRHPGLTGTKEGCASGDCGACTVLVRDRDGHTMTINSCITPVSAVGDWQIITVEGLGTPTTMHPVQDAMVSHHGSQCGFCTPGFVMAMAGYQLARGSTEALRTCTREDRVTALGGNLCRCTGYRPILAAAEAADAVVADNFPDASGALPVAVRDAAVRDARPGAVALAPGYHRPGSEQELRSVLSQQPPGAHWPLVAGATDLWLEVTQQYTTFDAVIDVSRVATLRRLERGEDALELGSAVTHGRLERFFGPDGAAPCRAIVAMLARFGSPQIRNRGTLGGNLGNGSPIADWPPLLLALDATVEIGDAEGHCRTVPMSAFNLAYRRTVLTERDYLRTVRIPGDKSLHDLKVGKISKRREDDISSVLGAFHVPWVGDRLGDVRVAYGGMAAVPVRVHAVEAVLRDQPPTDAVIERAVDVLREQLTPLTDVRASAAYRSAMAEALLRRALVKDADGDLTPL